MKTKVITITLIGILFYGNVLSQNIDFQEGAFETVLTKAKEENKLIFMDCYTVWCRPCKKLAKEVFPQKKVSTFFNKHYISLTMDMEKGEGIELAQYYNIGAYPTLLFLDANGKVLVKHEGLVSGDGLIEKGKTALDLKKPK